MRSNNHRLIPLALLVIIAIAALGLGQSRPTATRAQSCNQPPIPGGGQSVTWRAAESPYELCASQTIPEGGTVLVEAGVQLDIDHDQALTIAGALSGQGTASDPIAINAAAVFPPSVVVNGSLTLSGASLAAVIRPDSGADVSIRDSHFHTLGGVFNGDGAGAGIVDWQQPYVEVSDSTFDSAGLSLTDGTLVARNLSLKNGSLGNLRSYVYVDNISIDGGLLSFSKDYQPVYINNVSVRNSPNAGLNLGGSQAGNDFFIGPNVTLENNQYTVSLGSGGILPGSNLPTIGNLNNTILLSGQTDQRGPATLADLGLPYEVSSNPSMVGQWKILPGATFNMGPSASLAFGNGLEARGLPDTPITFQRLDPAQKWGYLMQPGRLEYVVVDGSQYGLIYSTSAPPEYLDSVILRNNDRAAVGDFIARSTQFLNNAVGAVTGFTLDLNGTTNPNSFTGNGLAVQSASDATFNWWGDPSGPTVSTNRDGSGDPIVDGVPYEPFRAQAPDFGDSPPIVRLKEPFYFLEPGSKVMLNWEAQDDVGIASQTVLFSPAAHSPQKFTLVAEDLPANQRAFEWTVPDIGFQVTGEPAYLRVVAVDGTGKEGWDEAVLAIPPNDISGDLAVTSDLSGPFQPGDKVDVCWSASGLDDFYGGVDVFLFVDGETRTISEGGTFSNCLPRQVTMPAASSDSARIGLRLNGNCCNRVKWFFSDPFTIRPDARVGDAAPQVNLISPTRAFDLAPATAFSIQWSASDDEGLRSFDIQASYNGGLGWHEIASDLPGSARSYTWEVAPGTGFSGVNLRVIAYDLRFQTSTASTLGGNGAPPPPTATPTATLTPTPTSLAPTPKPTFTPTPTATFTPAPTDTVTIQRAEYDQRKQDLRVEATSSDSSATLQVFATSTDELIGTLNGGGNGRFRGHFSWPTYPANITVRSSSGGSATAVVSLK